MDYLLKINKESECLEKEITSLQGQIRDSNVEKLGKEKKISELNKKLSKLKLGKHESLRKHEEKVNYLNGNVGQLKLEIQYLNNQAFLKEQIVSELSKKLSKVKEGKLKILDLFEEELKCLNETVIKLQHENQGLKDQKVEEHQMIHGLNKKLSELENVILEKDHMLGMYARMNSFKGIPGQWEHEIQVLKDDNLTAYQMIDKMTSEQSKANYEKNKIISELNEKMIRLEFQILENDQVVEMYEEMLEHSNGKVVELERENKDLKDQILSVKQTVVKMESEHLSATQIIERMKSKELASDQIIEEMVRDRSKANNALEELTHQNPEISKAVDELRSQVLVPTYDTGNINNVRIAVSRTPMVPSTFNSTKCTLSCLQKMGSKTQGRTSDEDAETPYDQAGSSGYSAKAETRGADQENKCKRLKRIDSLNNLCEEEKKCDSDDGDSMGLDDESCINGLIANARCQKLCNKWVSVDEMRKDFEQDLELCMNAVCVLYRHTINSPGELVHFDAMSGSRVAEYLINGDTQCRLHKFVDEVKRERPGDLALCRRLAMDYIHKLFLLCQNGVDHLFKFK